MSTENIRFADLGLAPEILKALEEFGYTVPTPIQAQAIPVVLQGHDLMAGAQTGTGKTAAFSLPLLQKLLPQASSSASPARHPVRALILTPTRELAIQVEESVKVYAKHTALRSLVVFGGVDIKTQTPSLMKGVEILVATPGRLLDHVEQRTVQLGQVQMLILDEADRMLDMGFMPDLKRILALLPKKRQNLMFSATFSNDIKKLSEEFLTNPKLIEVARSNAASDKVTQKVYQLDKDSKDSFLAKLLLESNSEQTIVFTKTKLTASRLARQLVREGIAADAIHGDKSQQERMQALEAFKQGKVTTLVATDVAARGLDIDQLPMVINFELPSAPEDYVHRIGRTGRAGASGTAISLVCPEEEKYLKEIEKLIKREIPRETAVVAERPRERAREAREPRADSADRKPSAPRSPAPRKNQDPWFDKPYEPSGNAEVKQSMGLARNKQKKEVAALLGGLLKRD
ncbi:MULTISPECIES: DEAD/DEAH box helicase [Methylovorus]|uniref:DEAD-box ATP-dependent RNA helicase RhpA n=1 Tax=Methylovorus glucosotrophus (strain SIP3-4) TaxID=582744 RepID=C6XEK9_METGS|nr:MULTISPECIES: DEAD/DEAH box helicase [Methylovorus]ACT50984.1 DEAD/DEAH box helicase domain protein [Methylovorus glucosotrophus SIP3-4]ADQ84892.1 DEAD/DEAH box helicase domain protein [Methylovorus sp. MP688]